MKKNTFNLNAYLEAAEERFSGFVGEDLNADGDDDFDGDDFDGDDNFEGEDMNAGGQMQSPTPYQLSITNSTAGTLNCVLFGSNQYLLTANYGSAVGISVVPSQSNVSYLEVLQQSASQPFETSLIRIQSSNTAQITQILTVTQKDANGQQVTIPVITQSYFSANQFQAGILDVPYRLLVDANTNVTFPVLATTTVVMTFFPAAKFNAVRSLMGGQNIKGYGAPAVAIGIPTVPVTSGNWARGRRSAPRRR